MKANEDKKNRYLKKYPMVCKMLANNYIPYKQIAHDCNVSISLVSKVNKYVALRHTWIRPIWNWREIGQAYLDGKGSFEMIAMQYHVSASSVQRFKNELLREQSSKQTNGYDE